MEKENLIIAYGNSNITINKGNQNILLTKEEVEFLLKSLIKNIDIVEIKTK